MKKSILAIAVLSTAVAFGAAKSGSYIGKAIALKSSQTARLVPEWDPDEKEEYEDFGVAYYTMTLKRGQAYTVWIEGGNAADIDLDVSTHETYYETRDDEPGATFSSDEVNGGAVKVAYLYADDWDTDPDGDPASGKYQVVLSGDVGASTTLSFVSGIRTFTVEGSEESPVALSMSTKRQTFSRKLVDGEFYFRTSLKAGRKYRIRTTGGTSANNLDLFVSGVEDGEPGDTQDTARLVNEYNDALVLVPDMSGKYEIIVSGSGSQAFKLQYEMVPSRSITAHAAIPLLKETGYSAKFVPGRIASTHDYYDSIVDEHLCKIYLKKGERWVFETEGATSGIAMIAYDSTGAVLSSNESIDGESRDVRTVITAANDGLYYVGVYDPLLDVEDVPAGGAIVLTARDTGIFMLADSFDPTDDAYVTANVLTPYPATTNDTAVSFTAGRSDAVEVGAIHGPHRFNAADLYDVFAFNCRKGDTYILRAEFADANDTTMLTLGAKLFNINAGKERNVGYKGTISPAFGQFLYEEDLSFKASVDGVHYLRVWVADGKGLDYPAYNIHAICARGESQLGLVKVVSRGASGTWSANALGAYPSGGALCVNTDSPVTVKAGAVSGFTAPDGMPVPVPAWEEGSDIMVVTNVYSDIYDKKYQTGTKKGKNGKTEKVYSPVSGDATPAGAFAIVPAAAESTLARTLWTDDPADFFTFTASANVYYNFELSNALDDGSGDAVITVSNAVSGVVFSGETEIARALLPAGTTYVIVSHGTEEKADSAYALKYSRAAGGVVRFSNAKGTAAVTSFSADEGAAAATLYVQRTGTEGAMRVRYATQAGTAIPGTNYYPVTEGEISWPAGSKAVKTVSIKLIPDIVPQWEASGKVFTVRLYPVDEYDLADGEYLPLIAADTATVTIAEKTAKKPGTVSLAAYGDDDAAVANVKKPSVSGTAGQPLKLTFGRTGGSDGPVSVKVASPTAAVAKKNKDTALSGRDYDSFSETLSWEDGDAEPKTVTVNLLPSTDYSATKKFIFTIAAEKTDGTVPTLSAKTATLTISNDKVAQTAAAYANTIAASTGLKLAVTGTWFNDYDGTFRSAAANGTVTYTLTGPGLFACKPTVVAGDLDADAATLTCQIVNKAAKLNETVSDFENRILRVIPAGTTTVTFKLSGVKGGAYVKFEPQADGAPYAWTKFAAATPSWPMNKAVVQPELTTSATWALPDSLSAESMLYCRVRFGTAANPDAVILYDAAHAGAAKFPEKLEAGKTYYWALDYACTDVESPTESDLAGLAWTKGPATWSFSALKAGAPITTVGSTCVDAAGDSIEDLVAGGEPVEMIQCVKPDLDLDGEGEGEAALSANKFRLVGGSLPKGLAINATTGVISGVPTTPGAYTALLQSYNETQTGTKKVKGKSTPVYTTTYGTTIPVKFNVLPAGSMVGSFRGVLREANGELDSDARRLGLLTVTATSAGKITAKATIGGVAYTFTGTAGYDEILDRDENAPGCTRHVQVTLKTTVKTLNSKKKVTGTYADNYLTLTIGDGSLTNAVALAEAAGTAELTLSVLNSAKTAVVQDVMYTANLCRSNGSTEPAVAALEQFSGYYTMALAPEGVSASDGVPVGNGYLTFTVAKTGSVKVSGVLADGTAVSLSTIGQPVGDTLEDPKSCTLVVPVYAGSATYAAGGDVKIAFPASGDLPVVLPSGKLEWEKNAAAATSRTATSFLMSLAPTGGWYDKVVNLQNYYLGREFAVSTVDSGDELPPEALASGYSFSTLSSPGDLGVSFLGNAVSVAARKLVKNNTTGLTDFGTSVNPWNTTVKFTRATGLVSGTFNAWEWVVKSDLANEYATAQKQISGLQHRGVLLFARDESSESPLADDVLTAGFFLMPATSSTKAADTKKAWKASLPFNIITVGDDEPVWDEKNFDE